MNPVFIYAYSIGILATSILVARTFNRDDNFIAMIFTIAILYLWSNET